MPRVPISYASRAHLLCLTCPSSMPRVPIFYASRAHLSRLVQGLGLQKRDVGHPLAEAGQPSGPPGKSFRVHPRPDLKIV
eukprot:scaffold7375_cov268-Pinguiococcus_pyrenoidosus.AAC.28